MTTKELLKKYGINSVYHFTDESNLVTIKKYGIQSLQNIEKKNIQVARYGAESISHSLDKRYGLDKYVHVAFIKDHPMYHVAKQRGSIVNPVWIEIDISVLFEPNTLCCDKVANQYNAILFSIEEIKNCIDFKTMLYSKDFFAKKEARKAEILVSQNIETGFIKGITYGN